MAQFGRLGSKDDASGADLHSLCEPGELSR